MTDTTKTVEPVAAVLRSRGRNNSLHDINRAANALDAANAEIERLTKERGDWRDDPAADERWNAGADYALDRLCEVLRVDPKAVSWDAATETLDGDIRAVVGNILTTAFGDDWPVSRDHIEKAEAESAALVAALTSAMEWIDAVPADTQLPTMPGFDRDAVDQLIAAIKEKQP